MANTKYYSEAVLKVDDTEDEPSMQHENVIAENNFRSWSSAPVFEPWKEFGPVLSHIIIYVYKYGHKNNKDCIGHSLDFIQYIQK